MDFNFSRHTSSRYYLLLYIAFWTIAFQNRANTMISHHGNNVYLGDDKNHLSFATVASQSRLSLTRNKQEISRSINTEPSSDSVTDLEFDTDRQESKTITTSALNEQPEDYRSQSAYSKTLYLLINQGCHRANVSGWITIVCSHLNSSSFYSLEFDQNHGEKPVQRLDELHIADTTDTNFKHGIIVDTIDYICGVHYDCSELRVFNLTRVIVDKKAHKLKEWIATFTKLTVLELSYMQYDLIDTYIPDYPSLPNLINLTIDGNHLLQLDFDQIMFRWPGLVKLSANYNNITQIRCTDVKKFTSKFKESSLGIVHNNLTCDKNLLWLIRLFVRKDYIFTDMDQIRCDQEKGTELTWQQWITVFETKICDICDCHSLKKTAIGVNCYNRNLTSLPEGLPPYTKVLNLTSNYIKSLSLPLGSKNWDNVTYVHLDNNLVTSIKAIETNLKLMKNLVALDIRRNKLQEFPIHILEQFKHLDQVNLSDNPWLCDCNTISFQEWLQKHFRKVRDMEQIKCAMDGNDENGVKSMHTNQRLSSRVIYRLSRSELCPQNNGPINWLDFVNVALTATIIVILLKVIMDYFYQKRTSKLPRFFKLNW